MSDSRTQAAVRLLTPEEAADQLGCGRSHIYRLIAAGEVRSVKVGRLRRVPSTEVEAYIANLMLAGSGVSDGAA